MTTDKKELALAALRAGTVIDHIPSNVLFKVVRILGIEKLNNHVTVGNNLQSGKLGTKGIIKVADIEFPETTLNRIAIIAPKAKVNIIRNYEVVDKRQVTLPDTIVGLVKCGNPKCITNNEPKHTRYTIKDSHNETNKCNYCGHTVSSEEAQID